MDLIDESIAPAPDIKPVRDNSAEPPRRAVAASGEEWRRKADHAVTLLLAVQAVSLFVVIPFGAHHALSRLMLDGCHLAFAAVAATLLVRRRALQVLLLAGLVALVGTPLVLVPSEAGTAGAALSAGAITAVAFLFNATITIMVARHVFGPGRVTSHRIQGAILVYLNVAALFSIAYGFVTSFDPAAIAHADGTPLAPTMGERIATLTYFSLTTITTTGFGDFVPVHSLARSLANLESVFGHLFPATMLARLVALNVTHARKG